MLSANIWVLHWVLSRNVTIFVFLLSKGIAGSHQTYMKTNPRHQMWKRLTIKTGIPVPMPDKREVGVLRQSFLLPKGNIFIFANSFLEFDDYTQNVCCLSSTSKISATNLSKTSLIPKSVTRLGIFKSEFCCITVLSMFVYLFIFKYDFGGIVCVF